MLGLLFSPIACILWLIVGAIAGGVAHQLVGKGSSQGFAPDLVLGLIGAVIGGMLLSLVGFRVDGSVLNPFQCIGHLFVATFGASVLILAGRWLRGNR